MADIIRDHRTLDIINNEDDKKYLTDFIEGYIRLSKDELDRTGYVDICNKIALYVDGHHNPIGFSDDSLTEFVKNNAQNFDLRKFQVKKDEHNIIFFSDNRVGEMDRGYDAEFTKAKKSLHANHDKDPKNDKLEWAIGRWIESWENRRRVWQEIRRPTIRYMLRYNRGFTRLSWDPFRKVKKKGGEVVIEYFHPLSVLVDPFPDKKFLLNSRYIMPFKKMPLPEAQISFANLGYDPKKVTSDTEADQIMSNGAVEARTGVSDQYVTVYFPEWSQYALDRYQTNIIEPDEMGNLTPQEAKEVNRYCFQGIYTTQFGLCHMKLNEFADAEDLEGWQFNTIPYEDEQSDLSVLGMSRVGKALVIQDLLNVVLTMKLNNPRHRNLIRGFINSKIANAWGTDLMKEFMNIGAIAPVDYDALGLPPDFDIKKLIQFLELPDTSAELGDLLIIIDNVIKRQTIRKETLTGQLPTKTSEQMSGVLARELKASNETLLQPLVQNIEWSAETESRLVYRMLAKKFKEDDWVPVTGGNKNDPKYIPIEAHWPSNRFYMFLARAYPGMPLVDAAKKFDEHNLVEVERNKNPQTGVYADPETGTRLNAGQVETSDKYHINSLIDEDGELQQFTFKVDMVFDAEDTKYEDKVLAGQLFAKNPQSLVLFEIFLEQQGGYWSDNKDMILEKYKNENEAMKRLEFIQSLGPDFWKAFLGFAQQWQAMQASGAGMAGGGQGAEQPAGEMVEA